MSNTSNSASGSDAGSHFTVEDSGTTTDAADLVHDDESVASTQAGSIGTTTAASHPSTPGSGSRDEDPVEAADEVVRSTGDVAADPDRRTVATDGAPAAAAAREAEPGAREVEQQPLRDEGEQTGVARGAEQTVPSPTAADGDRPSDRGGLSALADADLGHVFDQTNGVIERADGDSDGSAESDVFSEGERLEDDPVVVDSGVHGAGEVPESRRTGD